MITELNEKIVNLSSEKFEERKVVLGEGKVNAKIMLIGEAPGGEEEKKGHPFVGAAGKNLNEFLEIIKLKRENIYLSNVVKIRPFKVNEKTNRKVNRAPNKEELDFFTPFLHEEIKIIKPEIIVTLGNTALRAVFKDKTKSIGEYHGKITEDNNIKVFALYHPASVIYDQNLKETYLNDLHNFAKILSDYK